MAASPVAARATPAWLREARRALLESGAVTGGPGHQGLMRSWQRSLDYGLASTGRVVDAPHASAAQLQRAQAAQHELMSHARPVMEFLFEQTRDSDSMVILADSQGMLLQALGDAHFVNRAERVALRPGAIWHEQWRGTNAIGTALAEQAAVVVHGGEHYLARNGFLTCTAAPIVDSSGRLLGVLDVSGDHRGYHPHTLGLVRSAARMIEHRLFDTRHAGGLRLRLHAQAEGIGTLTEMLLAVSPEGWIVGANAQALTQLGLRQADIGQIMVDRVLALDTDTLHGWCLRPSGAPRSIQLTDGHAVWARVEPGRQMPGRTPPSPKPTTVGHRDALAELESGDPLMQTAINRARCVLGKPIALLLQGETGVGKEVFARAVHASGPRRDAPWVAVNCAALPETLIEAELFGYRAGAFTGAHRDGAPGRIREAQGGTLFLDEIGDMPLAVQGRLLRVLQERQVTPLGGGKPVAVDFALIGASHRRLREEMQAGRFREDLYYRINGLSLQLPALRERQDLPALTESMLARIAPGRAITLAPELARAFAGHRWPGNLRQLQNALQTACALMADDETELGWAHLPDDLAEDLRADAPSKAVPDADADLRLQSNQLIARTVQACAGNLSDAARRLGISRNTLYRKLKTAAA
ncbi:MAG: sigma-54-dependent Fis family transcriptional regulator [Burkholderiaceae bacterium]|nr:sigma-54-dependent Fis family transcriptional regulator [Burkholderiaceae bacterium]MBT9502164.1 sigma-54-dependent Fis family transcriptional regulator [Burkholderiaceae bacterium]